MTKNIIIAGGGTGGHIFPAVAIANAIKKLDSQCNILFVGANGKMEMEKIPLAGYAIKGIDMAGFQRKSILKNLSLPFKIIKSFFQVKKIFQEFKPDAVIGVGGYSTFPVLRYAQQKNILNFVFEVNSFAGKANLMLGKKATLVFTASDGMEKFFPQNKIIITGNPVRNEIVQNDISKANALQYFNLKENIQTVFVFGGSQGAQSINKAIAKGINAFEKNNLQLIWQTGKATAATYLPIAGDKQNIWVNEFIDKMHYAYAAADIIVCRSGGTVYELCIVGKPAILVPFPYATEDHQKANAMRLVNKNAALIVEDSAVDEKLVEDIVSLSYDALLKNSLAKNIAALASTHADDKIALHIINLLNARHI